MQGELIMIAVTTFAALFMGVAAGFTTGWHMKERSDEYDRMQAERQRARKNRETFLDKYKEGYDD